MHLSHTIRCGSPFRISSTLPPSSPIAPAFHRGQNSDLRRMATMKTFLVAAYRISGSHLGHWRLATDSFTLPSVIYNPFIPGITNELDELTKSLGDISPRTENAPIILSSISRHELRLFRRRWNRFSLNLISQWHMINYVSAVFIGYVYLESHLFL